MANYETVLIARQDVSATQVESITDLAQEILTEDGGRIARREYWGLRGLAFRIKKNRKGHYVLMNIDAPAPALHEMERQMRIHEDVLRYMTIRVDSIEEGPSAMLRNKDRDDRPRRGDRGGSRYEQSDNDSGDDKSSKDKEGDE